MGGDKQETHELNQNTQQSCATLQPVSSNKYFVRWHQDPAAYTQRISRLQRRTRLPHHLPTAITDTIQQRATESTFCVLPTIRHHALTECSPVQKKGALAASYANGHTQHTESFVLHCIGDVQFRWATEPLPIVACHMCSRQFVGTATFAQRSRPVASVLWGVHLALLH